MKKFKTYGLIAFLFGAIISCEKELDIEPIQEIPQEVALSSSENIVNLLTGAYESAGNIDAYGGRLQMLSDLYGFTDQATWVGTFQQPRQVFSKNILVNNSFIRDFWGNAYSTINMANLVIDHIDIVEPDLQKSVMGQALFLRALSYFDLVRFFGANYEPGAQNTQPGVPLSLKGITDYDTDLTIARSSVEEVYAQVISDLQEAYELLKSPNSYFAGKYTTKALLARVYLQQGNYQGALQAASEVITDSKYKLTPSFEGAFNNDVNSTEDIFAIQITSQDGTNDLITHYADQPFGGRGGDIVVEETYIDLFDDENDERAGFFYISDYNGGTLTSKYTNQFGNVPVIRLAEMYLIRAECNLRLGSETGDSPLNDVNTIRQRAGAAPRAAVTLDDILLERELELAFEGFLIHDLKRTQRSVGELPYNDNRLLYPIPQREMDVNSLLEQNPGYGN
ncbi:RagB/SusD family nutrient uptake outer membrane protein [Sinomicrobium weinanense]|uniref:RagB/SusD family nutrient uptake outer membrane protein n=1 Tax=Sinomicrobium weinanense TaxID=2842200 RepID=A0A926JUM9_9FLAO|nr:RagB/SusD family nutrient uptake outer membrane protein [Sinomicrobium weinanense]MBC9797639.1 RagB/SusD family nutrient uptake outer membrane protein [Sinomicrobium weinanense]MBU3125259.1 RagB/SusD family nutrient uptake outer membrane protein [Sinomicrobium weinanense]